jgi:DNA-binding CsgD family transcriptional regulator
MLTRRQGECLLWVRAGKSSTDIGVILGLSPRTVDEHIAAACERLGVRTRTQAVAEAIARGLLR